MLQKELCRILDLPHNFIPNEKKKLIGTYMVINTPHLEDRIVYVRDIGDHSIRVAYEDGKDNIDIPEEDVKSLEVFLPDTDVYKLDAFNCFATVSKRAQKQWKKSYNTDSYSISVKVIKATTNFIDSSSVNFINALYHTKPEPRSFWIHKETLMLFDKPVAKLEEGGGYTIINNIFKQEIEEYIKFFRGNV